MPQDDEEAQFRQGLASFHEAYQRLGDLTKNFDNLKIVGSGVSGDSRKGFCINCPPCEEAQDGGMSGVPIIPPPPPSTGACCVGLDCTIETVAGCASMGGTYQGDNTPCDFGRCGTPVGACCRDGGCTVEAQESCESGGGIYQGDDTECDPNPCPQPTGACCVDVDCSIETEEDCTGLGGSYQGDDSVCDPNPCEDGATGACCIDGGTCVPGVTPAACAAEGGFYLGNGSVCVGSQCGDCWASTDDPYGSTGCVTFCSVVPSEISCFETTEYFCCLAGGFGTPAHLPCEDCSIYRPATGGCFYYLAKWVACNGSGMTLDPDCPNPAHTPMCP